MNVNMDLKLIAQLAMPLDATQYMSSALDKSKLVIGTFVKPKKALDTA